MFYLLWMTDAPIEVFGSSQIDYNKYNLKCNPNLLSIFFHTAQITLFRKKRVIGWL